jgi:hypothetical protein
MAHESAWGPSKRWYWGDYDRYLSYYSRDRRTRNRWEFVIAGSGSAARTPWTAMLRARRFYRSQRRPS